ncbi:DNA primase [Candidatus Woesearchaeota archaeon]|nr:DNA primase [Candidatus Woesearchaeota archaeon]
MGKISQIASKYIIHTSIEIEGVIDRPDVIGAIFGQTEGLLGSELELRELQRSGRIGRIEVNVDVRGGKSQGFIVIPSSLDKAETCIIAASLEIIQRIGPCNARLRVQKIEDVRISKRQQVIERAKELLRQMVDVTMPDSQELSEEVGVSIRTEEITEYGKDRLPAGPEIEESDEIIVVEGRADVLTLLKNGFKNAIAMNGTSVPQTIKDLCGKKTVTVFVDGDRGGDLIIRELMTVAEIDFVTKAPDGKEVEELAKKEIHKALRSKVAAEQVRGEFMERKEVLRRKTLAEGPQGRPMGERPMRDERRDMRNDRGPRDDRREPREERAPLQRMPMSDEQKERLREIFEGLLGTRGACILDEKLNVLGKVPVSELSKTVRSVSSAYAVVFDGVADPDIVSSAEAANVQYMLAMESKVDPRRCRLNLTIAE